MRESTQRYEMEFCILPSFAESPERFYRKKEWVKSTIPYAYVIDFGKTSGTQTFDVNIVDLFACQHYVNSFVVGYYIEKIRREEEIERIRVAPLGDKWIIVNGTHRTEAYKYLMRKTIPAYWGPGAFSP